MCHSRVRIDPDTQWISKPNNLSNVTQWMFLFNNLSNDTQWKIFSNSLLKFFFQNKREYMLTY